MKSATNVRKGVGLSAIGLAIIAVAIVAVIIAVVYLIITNPDVVAFIVEYCVLIIVAVVIIAIIIYAVLALVVYGVKGETYQTDISYDLDDIETVDGGSSEDEAH